MESENDQRDVLKHCKYWAFISYSHHDKFWGEWLHRSLESYRMPRRLVGRPGRDGPVPKRLFPIFRDTEELPASGSLSKEIHDALASSRCLVVICSPASAQSNYVNEEIHYFKSFRRADRVFCLITAGEPNASATDGNEDRECFPKVFRYEVLRNGHATETLAQPIAADVRGGRKTRNTAKLKLLAGILGLDYDELRRRDVRRKHQRILGTVASFLVIGMILVTTWLWQEKEKKQQINLQKIETYTLTGKRELEAGDSEKAAAYLADAYRLGGEGIRQRLLLARAMRGLDMQGNTIASLAAPIREIRFDPNGQYMLTRSGECRVDVWDTQTLACVATLDDKQENIEVAVFTPNGRKIITCGLDRLVRIWETRTGQMVNRLDQHRSLLTALAVSPDGHFFATLGADGSGVVWRLNERSLLTRLKGQIAIRPPAVFSPDGTRLATLGYVGDTLCVWGIETGDLLHTIPVNEDTESLCYTPDGRHILAPGKGGELQLIDTTNYEVAYTLQTASEELVYSGIAAEDESAVLLTASGEVQVWDLKKHKQVHCFPTMMANGHVADFDGYRLVLISDDKPSYVSVWEVRTGTRIVTAKIFSEDLCVAALSPCSDLLVTGSESGLLIPWHMDKRARDFVLPGHRAMVNFVEFSPDGSKLVTGGSEASAKIWETANGKQVATLDRHEAAIIHSEYTHDGSRLVTYSLDHEIGIWDGHSYKLIQYIPKPDNTDVGTSHGVRIYGSSTDIVIASYVGDTAFLLNSKENLNIILKKHRIDIKKMTLCPDGSLLATGNADGTVEVWDTSTGKLCHRLWGHTDAITSMEFSAGASRLLTTSADATAIVWSMSCGEIVSKFDLHTDTITEGKFHPNNQIAATASKDRTAKLWNAESGVLLVSLGEHAGQISTLVFSCDGKLVITGCDDKVVRIWDSETGELIHALPPHAGPILSIRVSPNGNLLATAAKDTVAKLWDLRLETRPCDELIRILEARSKIRIVGGRLVVAEKSAEKEKTNGLSTELSVSNNVPKHAVPELDQSTPDKAVGCFISALSSGLTKAMQDLIAEDAGRDGLEIRTYSEDQLKHFGTLFVGAEIHDCFLRNDSRAALVAIHGDLGWFDLSLKENGGIWRITNIRGRP